MACSCSALSGSNQSVTRSSTFRSLNICHYFRLCSIMRILLLITGHTVSDLNHIVFAPGAFGGHEAGGYLFIRQTFQCLQKISVPEPPYLFAILLQKWELPWARAFPLRLMLRLGAEYRCMFNVYKCFQYQEHPMIIYL